MAESERLTPFMLFFCETKPLVLAENPSDKPAEIARTIFERWKGATSEVSRAYSVLSAAYAETKKANPSVARRKRKLDRDPKAPKAGEWLLAEYHHSLRYPIHPFAVSPPQQRARTCTSQSTTGPS